MRQRTIATMTVLVAPTIAAGFASGVAVADPGDATTRRCVQQSRRQLSRSGQRGNIRTKRGYPHVRAGSAGGSVAARQRHSTTHTCMVHLWAGGDAAAGDVTPSGLTWVGWNQDANKSPCAAEQIHAGRGPSVVMPIRSDQLQEFHLLPNLTTLTLRGSCSWRPAGSSPYGP